MNAKLFLPLSMCYVGFAFSTVSVHSQNVVTFDDLSETASGSFIANGYQGLSWSNFACLNAVRFTNTFGVSGYYYGMVSASNVAYGAFSGGAEIDSVGTNFDLLSAYLTGAWSSNLNIEVEGFRSGALVYDKIVVAGATTATLFTFDYLDIDRVYFNPYGGENEGFPGGAGVNFVMDNLTFELVPEPSSLLLTAIGAMALWSFFKRRRV